MERAAIYNWIKIVYNNLVGEGVEMSQAFAALTSTATANAVQCKEASIEELGHLNNLSNYPQISVVHST
jgi:hypothetical protein